ncbi:hypothetical protein TWF481_010405 [Arthrobotrys musiformis]|uniref:Uncharacterized protein n=1 Tax=Arthrobotrys musiformis TaxID=47236 RepID=A0AAV9W320_9PEZI
MKFIAPKISKTNVRTLTIKGACSEALAAGEIFNALEPGLEGLSLTFYEENEEDESLDISAAFDIASFLRHQHTLEALHIDIPHYQNSILEILPGFQGVSELGLSFAKGVPYVDFVYNLKPFAPAFGRIKHLHMIHPPVKSGQEHSRVELRDRRAGVRFQLMEIICGAIFARTSVAPELEYVSMSEGSLYEKFRVIWHPWYAHSNAWDPDSPLKKYYRFELEPHCVRSDPYLIPRYESNQAYVRMHTYHLPRLVKHLRFA